MKVIFTKTLMFLILFVQAVSNTSAFADSFFDAAGMEIHVNDRVLIHGENGYVRQITELSGPIHSSSDYFFRANDPSWYAVGCFKDSIFSTSNTNHFNRGIKIYKSIEDAQDLRIGDFVTFRPRQYIHNQMQFTNEIKQGKVIELFSGGFIMVKTS